MNGGRRCLLCVLSYVLRPRADVTCPYIVYSQVHLKHALFLEDEERFPEAEAEFVKAGKPKEAIDMYLHQNDWDNAMRVAERCDPTSISDVVAAQAKVAADRKDWRAAEQLYVSAKKPEAMLQTYRDQQARLIARFFNPSRVF